MTEQLNLTPAEADVIVRSARCIMTGSFIPVIRYRARPEFATALAKLAAVPEMAALVRALRLVGEGKFIASRIFRGQPEFTGAVAQVASQLTRSNKSATAA